MRFTYISATEETTNCQQQQTHAIQNSDCDDKSRFIARPGENLFETIRKRMFKMLPNYQKPWPPRYVIFDRSQAKRKMKEKINSLTAVQKKYVATLGKMQKFISTMPNEWRQVHLYEKQLKSDLRLLEKEQKKANPDNETERELDSKITSLKDEKKIHAIQKEMKTFKKLLFGFYN